MQIKIYITNFYQYIKLFFADFTENGNVKRSTFNYCDGTCAKW